MRLLICFISLIVIIGNKSWAKPNIDSLLQQLKILESKKSSWENDSLIVSTLIKISRFYSSANDDSALIFLEKSLKIAQKRNWNWGLQKAFTSYGNVYLMANDYPNALQYYLKALEITEKVEDTKSLAAILYNIGIVYQEQNLHEKAVDYFQKALMQYEKDNNIEGRAVALTGIGEIYKAQKNYKQALETHLEVLKIAQSKNNQRRMAIAYHNIGEIYGELGEFDKGIDFLQKGMFIDEQLGLKADIAINNNVIAKVLYKKGAYKEAIEYAQKTKLLAEEMQLKDEIKNATEVLYLSYKKLNDYPNALLNYEIFSNYKDSLFNQDNIVKISQLEKEFVLAKKQYETNLMMKENEKQDLKQNLTILILLALVSVATFGILYTRKKYEITKLQHEKKLAEIAFLNAHQTRAPLATLLGLLYLIDKSKLQDAETVKIFDMMIEAAQKLDEVIHQINDKAQKKSSD